MTRFSVVIPTHQRRELVVRNVRRLEDQVQQDFEVIVVDDGSTDGTVARLRELDVAFALTVIAQDNRGAGAARNAGAAAATGEVLVFLDDDMEAHPRLLGEHERSHAEGADVVLGDLPLHPDSPRNLLTSGVGWWALRRRERLSITRGEIGREDLLTGQISISRANYDRLEGFDASFTRDGAFGGEDIDFGHRALDSGLRVVFNPDAISYQYYAVDPATYLDRAREAGRASQELLVKHPERAETFGPGPHFARRRERWLLGPFVQAPRAVSWPLRAVVVALARSVHTGPRLRKLFFLLRTVEHLRGAREGRAAGSTGEAVVLAYHAIADLRADTVLSRYSVPPARFAEQLDSLAFHGWAFVDLSAVLDALAGVRALPRRAVLVTFDDAYADLSSAALPVLTERGIPAVAFAVTAQTGGSNVWDRGIGAGELALLDADGLRTVATEGVEIGSHGVSHRSLAALDPAEIASEVEASAAHLESLGLPRPRVFSYPYGEWRPEAAVALRAAGYLAAFTVEPGVVQRGTNRYTLPRVEVGAGDTPRRLRLHLATLRWPAPWRERLLRRVGRRG